MCGGRYDCIESACAVMNYQSSWTPRQVPAARQAQYRPQIRWSRSGPALQEALAASQDLISPRLTTTPQIGPVYLSRRPRIARRTFLALDTNLSSRSGQAGISLLTSEATLEAPKTAAETVWVPYRVARRSWRSDRAFHPLNSLRPARTLISWRARWSLRAFASLVSVWTARTNRPSSTLRSTLTHMHDD